MNTKIQFRFLKRCIIYICVSDFRYNIEEKTQILLDFNLDQSLKLYNVPSDHDVYWEEARDD